MSSVTPAAPRVKSATTTGGAASAPSAPRCDAYELRRDSELNRRGLEIIAAAEHLRDLLADLPHSHAADKLLLEIVAETGSGESDDLGSLQYLEEDAAGFRWAVEMFLSTFCTNTIPLPEPEPRPAPASAVRRRRAAR